MERIKYWLHTLRRLRHFFDYNSRLNRTTESKHLSKGINSWITISLALNPYESNYDLIRGMLHCKEGRNEFERYVNIHHLEISYNPLIKDYPLPTDDDCKFVVLHNAIVISEFNFNLTPMHFHLIKRYNAAAVVSACLRYRCFSLNLNDPGHQWSVDPKIKPGWPEGFGGPFNIRDKDVLYCSAFADDVELGSLGSFFMVDLERISDHWIIDPPFIELILKLAAQKIIKTDVKFLFCMVKWTDSDAYRILSQQVQLVERTYPRLGHYYYDQQQPIIAPFDSVHFVNH